MSHSMPSRPHARLAAIAAIALCLLGFAGWAHAAEVPTLTAHVTDLTGTLTPSQGASLERRLTEFERRKGSQIAVLIVPTTAPETIEQYAVRAFEVNKLGRTKVDDGVLLLVAKQDRKLHIEVGYGLEGAIPDAIAKRVVDEVIVPFFKRGDFFGGIEAGAQQLTRLVDGEPLPARTARDPSWRSVGDLLPFLFIFIIVIGGVLRAIFGRVIGSAIGSTGAGVVGWIFGGLVFAIPAALIVLLLLLVMSASSQRGWNRGWSGGSSGWGGSSWGGGGGGFGGSSGGGFSGGGGSSGGGGASGSW